MFDWLKNLGTDDSGLKPIVDSFNDMMIGGRHAFDLSVSALLGGTSPDVVRREIFDTDRKINQTEQLLRRRLIVHASVHGSAEFPTCLVLMSIAKDAERIGDYCKNIYDLAVTRPMTDSDQHREDVLEMKDKVSSLLGKMISIYGSKDDAAAKSFLQDTDTLEDTCDERIKDLLLASDSGSPDAVVAALCFRYLKRITAHSKNIVTSIVMPVDKLDFLDEG